MINSASFATRSVCVASVDIRQLLDAEGGFTVRRRTGRSIASGIAVATRPSRSLSFSRHHWCDETVSSWLAETGRSWRTLHIGGWLDTRTDIVWLDVVRVVPSRFRPLASLIGRLAGQHCVFDLGRREMVVLR